MGRQEKQEDSAAEQISGMRRSSRKVGWFLLAAVALYLLLLALGAVPPAHVEEVPLHGDAHAEESTEPFVPSLWAVLPFAALLLAIALLPLIEATKQWWHHNRNRFLLAAGLALVTLLYYGLMHPGGVPDHLSHGAESQQGWDTVLQVLSNAVFSEYVPFIVLLFALYTISGGISLRGDLPAHPTVNCMFIGIGTLLASFIGTTGAAMVLIRPLITTNAERRYKIHTILFFIFMVCNCGGLLLPIGDPPLFLGYLRGVPFTWTLSLWPYWLGVNATLLTIYYVWDRIQYSKEPVRGIMRDERRIRPLELSGVPNIFLIVGVVFSVAFIIPGDTLPGTHAHVPHFLREAVMILLVIISLRFTRPEARYWNRFDYHAILEVAALFFGIFICMQVPIEILHIRAESLGINSPFSFFWATGVLSSFLDNAPTYVVFFETAAALPHGAGSVVALEGGREILEIFLIPISLGAVFMGANTYIGNGPNFMVKSIAEQSGIRMPSFFGYMLYSSLILLPVWLGVTFFL